MNIQLTPKEIKVLYQCVLDSMEHDDKYSEIKQDLELKISSLIQ